MTCFWCGKPVDKPMGVFRHAGSEYYSCADCLMRCADHFSRLAERDRGEYG